MRSDARSTHPASYVVCHEERNFFDIGPVLALSGSEMQTARHADDPGQNRRLDRIVRDLLSTGTHNQYIDELTTGISAAAMQSGWKVELL